MREEHIRDQRDLTEIQTEARFERLHKSFSDKSLEDLPPGTL